MNVTTTVRNQRIKDNLEHVGTLGAVLAGDKDYYAPYRKDMESAGTVALVKAAGLYTGDAFRSYVGTVIRRDMVAEAQRIDGTVRSGARGEEKRQRVEFDPVNVDSIANMPAHENGVLTRVDRMHALDMGWQERERAVPERFVGAAMGRARDLSGVDREIWRRRRVENEWPGRVALDLNMDTRELLRRERALVTRVGGA